jgi:hypothetical protein
VSLYLGNIELNQSHDVDAILEKFDMIDCNMAYTPAASLSMHNVRTTTDSSLLDSTPAPTYKQMVGSLLYLSVCTRPDILTDAVNT